MGGACLQQEPFHDGDGLLCQVQVPRKSINPHDEMMEDTTPPFPANIHIIFRANRSKGVLENVRDFADFRGFRVSVRFQKLPKPSKQEASIGCVPPQTAKFPPRMGARLFAEKRPVAQRSPRGEWRAPFPKCQMKPPTHLFSAEIDGSELKGHSSLQSYNIASNAFAASCARAQVATKMTPCQKRRRRRR